MLDVSSTDIQEATIDDVADGGVGNWISLTEPSAVLDHVTQTLGVVVLISSKQTQHLTILRQVFFWDVEIELISKLNEGFNLGLLFILELLRCCIDEPLFGAFIGISDE